MKTEKLEFVGHAGGVLAARLDMPDGDIRGYALFAHCFTCSKDLMAVRRISAGLARHGIALMRFDFTGLGASDGEFASTNFSSNIEDLKRAAAHLAEVREAPRLIIGHSLGGAAVLAAASSIPSIEAVVTIGAPADVAHVLHNFGADLAEIEGKGEATVSLHGREFTIERQFIEDARTANLSMRIAALRKPLLILHAPLDNTVGIENAALIFAAAKHPKSFVSLDGADHLLTRAQDAEYAASVIAGWSSRYIGSAAKDPSTRDSGPILVTETGHGRYQQRVDAHGHRLMADEPSGDGGTDTGPTPYDFLAIALGACTSMTLRMYAEKKELKLDQISVEVDHTKVHASDCVECIEKNLARPRIDRFERRIRIRGGVDDGMAADLLRIADLCPVHRTLEASSVIITQIMDPR
ncbi:osmotically inducible protein C [Rhizobium leguminosarum]|uniref:Osmotically inducible protein C n=1 Tax=Rhizobium leguminosarum TaxID=384 RepID=A0A4Q1UCN1_RHILE|nr:bifunctional alpha/beta hydrolase/OsmC family protein [Rhizobium leguminosarum]RXT29812.1 osmotically inducible protein C [Rhizobium leguminosarum]